MQIVVTSLDAMIRLSIKSMKGKPADSTAIADSKRITVRICRSGLDQSRRFVLVLDSSHNEEESS
jgi:hypothetical protein